MALDETLQSAFEIPIEAKTCAISLDGVLIPTRYTRVIASDSRWAEACCGTVSFFDGEGDLISTRYLARMPEHKKKTLKTQLALQIEHICTTRPDLLLVKVADGARDNWTFLDGQIEQGESVLDFYHAAEHLFNALKLVHPKDSPELYEAFRKYRRILLNDNKGMTKIINHLTAAS